jgi:tetratricopeptide (TPR) repeat protein
MDALHFFEERVTFSPDLPAEVNRLMQAGVAASGSDAEMAVEHFRQALAVAPQCLEAYFALYKYFFHLVRFAEAEQVALAGLAEAARQADIPHDWRKLAATVPIGHLYASKATLFYLYTLKALAFIKLRRGLKEEAQAVLTVVRQFDPEDRSGASVIASLAEALDE